MSISENATVVLYIPQGVTLTARGANGSGRTGGGAGILVPPSSTLVITGAGTVNARGGNAGNGGKGSSGGAGDSAGGSPSNPYAYACSGNGGKGGAGGGGAGAGIGGKGGTGVEGGAGGAGYSTGYVTVPSSRTGVKNHGSSGSSGSAGTGMGTVVLLGTVSVSATGGSSGTSGNAGTAGAISGWAGVPDHQGGELKGYGASGGGGGGGGAGGASAQGIGGGGGSGGGGAGGDNGNIYWGIERVGYGYASMTPGNSGSSSSSAGRSGDAGTLCKSEGATINSSRVCQPAETHAAAQYVISFDANGGSVSSGGESAIATLGCQLPDCPNHPERFGHRFTGWTTAANEGVLYYSADGTKGVSSYSSPNSMTLFAQWEKLPFLTVVSPFDVCSPSVGVHPMESPAPTVASCPETHVDGKYRFDCIGWHGTGDVPSSGSKTNVSFTVTRDSLLSWSWKTNVWIDCQIGGNATSESVAGWYPINGGSVVVPFETQETKCVALMSGDTNGVSVDMASKTVIVPTDSPHDLSVEILDAVNKSLFPLSWSDVNGETDWIVVEDPSASDGFCLKSGSVTAGSTSSTTLDVEGPGRLDFDWKISANRGDYARVYVDGVQKVQITRDTAWSPVSLVIEGTGSHAICWSYERKAATAAKEDAAFLDNVTWRPLVSLAVSSSEGVTTPATGILTYYWGDRIAASVVAPEPGMDERFVFTGWTGTGSVPACGIASNVEFSITEESTLTWNWRTEYLIALATAGAVVSDFTNVWAESGTVVVVPYRLATSYAEFDLAGDTDGIILDKKARTLTIPADRPRSIVLRTTATLTLAEALDGPGLVWSTDPGAEWTAQTTVTADGVDAAVSGPVDSSNDSNGINTSVTGAGTLRWRWKLVAVGTAGMDVIVDGDFANPVRIYATSGDWAVDSLELTGDAPHDIRFEFWNTGLSFSDRAYLDMVSWSPAGEVRDRTIATPASVMFSWFDEYRLGDGSEDGYETAALAMAANDVNKVWECYVAGLDPTNATSRFEARVEFENGKPVVQWSPDLGAARDYIVEGKENLGDGWGPTNAASRFFRVKVKLPE